MPKKREVASLVGNFSPVKSSNAILVRSMRHLRGEMGEELKRRAEGPGQRSLIQRLRSRTFLEDRGSVDSDNRLLSVFVLLARTHHENVLSPDSDQSDSNSWEFSKWANYKLQG